MRKIFVENWSKKKAEQFFKVTGKKDNIDVYVVRDLKGYIASAAPKSSMTMNEAQDRLSRNGTFSDEYNESNYRLKNVMEIVRDYGTGRKNFSKIKAPSGHMRFQIYMKTYMDGAGSHGAATKDKKGRYVIAVSSLSNTKLTQEMIDFVERRFFGRIHQYYYGMDAGYDEDEGRVMSTQEKLKINRGVIFYNKFSRRKSRS